MLSAASFPCTGGLIGLSRFKHFVRFFLYLSLFSPFLRSRFLAASLLRALHNNTQEYVVECTNNMDQAERWGVKHFNLNFNSTINPDQKSHHFSSKNTRLYTTGKFNVIQKTGILSRPKLQNEEVIFSRSPITIYHNYLRITFNARISKIFILPGPCRRLCLYNESN